MTPALEAIFVVSAMFVNVGVLIGGLWHIHRAANHIQRIFEYFALEHEILMRQYAEDKGIQLEELPTRMGKAPWWKQ